MCMSLFFCNFVPDFVNNGKMFRNMKKILVLFAAVLMACSTMAANKMKFVVEGPEEVYNLIKVVNETSIDSLTCRIVVVDDDDNVKAVYGTYEFDGKKDTDSKVDRIWRGTTLGIQFQKDFKDELTFDVEYVDRPLFVDFIVIHLRDKVSGFEDKL